MYHRDGFACEIKSGGDHINLRLCIPGKEYKEQTTDKPDDLQEDVAERVHHRD